jgi:hypothetical protein
VGNATTPGEKEKKKKKKRGKGGKAVMQWLWMK